MELERYTIRDVRRDDPREAERLAELWNSSDAGWPEGLTHGVPMTGERILERLRRADWLIVLAAETDGGEIVGYADVSRLPGRDDIAYGVLLNVRPDWHDKGCGKAIVLAILDRLEEMGYRQFSADTWSGNLKAIPLYKKTGFFWEPGTGVHLQNFIPMVLSLPVARPFFARHGWYESLRRELTVAPDEVRWHGIRVYPYRFQAGEDLLTLVIDRQSEAPTAVETGDFYAAFYAGREEVVCGFPQTLTWEIVNKRRDGTPLRAEIAAEGPPGVELKVAETFEVMDKLRLERPFLVSTAIERPQRGQTQTTVRSSLVVAGTPLELGVGVRTAQPVDIEVQGTDPVPGKPDEEVVVRLRNRLREAITGEVVFETVPGLELDRWTAPFTVAARDWVSCRFRLTAEEGPRTTQVRVVCRPEENPGLGLTAPLETRPKPVTFHPVPLDHVYAWTDPEDPAVVIETPVFSARAQLLGGSLAVYERSSGQLVLHQSPPAVGPPFEGQIAETPCEHRIETAGGRVRLTLVVTSRTVPGVTIERTVTAGAGPFLRLTHRIYNSTGAEQHLKLRCNGEMHLHRGVTVPLAWGFLHEVVEGVGDFPREAGRDLPRDPALYSEGWTAREEHGLVVGLVWKSCGEIEGGSVQFELPAMAPRSSVEVDPLHFVAARGDWTVVRDLWRRLWQPGGGPEESSPEAHPVLTAAFEPAPPLIAAARTEADLVVRNRRLQPFDGGWALASEEVVSEPAEGELSGVTPAEPASRRVVLSCPDLAPRAARATLALTSATTRELREEPVLVLGEEGREVSVDAAGDGARISVENGWLGFDVAPGHHGAIISLRRQGNELLVSSFPQPRPYQWMSAWFGGVEPFLENPGDVRYIREAFTAEPVERRGVRGLTWHGVRVTCPVRHPDASWLLLTCEYLTLGASNVLALALRLSNRSTASQKASAGFIVFPAVTSHTRVHYEVRRPSQQAGASPDEQETVPRFRAAMPYNFRFGDARWVAMDVKTGEEPGALTLVSLQPRGEAGGWLLDRGTGGLHTRSSFQLEPGETREKLAWLAVAAGPQQARAYRALGALAELP